MISYNPLWRHQIERFSALLSLCAGKPQVKVDSFHRGTVTRTFDVFVVSLKKMLNKLSIGRYFKAPWRSFDVAVMYWIVIMVVAGGLTLIRRQDILNRHSEIGQWHIYRHAFFSQSCPVVSATLRKWQRYPMQETSFLLLLWLHRCIVCNDCNAVYSRLVLFFWSVTECHQYR